MAMRSSWVRNPRRDRFRVVNDHPTDIETTASRNCSTRRPAQRRSAPHGNDPARCHEPAKGLIGRHKTTGGLEAVRILKRCLSASSTKRYAPTLQPAFDRGAIQCLRAAHPVVRGGVRIPLTLARHLGQGVCRRRWTPCCSADRLTATVTPTVSARIALTLVTRQRIHVPGGLMLGDVGGDNGLVNPSRSGRPPRAEPLRRSRRASRRIPSRSSRTSRRRAVPPRGTPAAPVRDPPRAVRPG